MKRLMPMHSVDAFVAGLVAAAAAASFAETAAFAAA
jgi:hypothetical protein